MKKATLYYILAFLVVLVWSFTFVSTKALLVYMSPTEIMLYRFIIAYIALWFLYPKIHKVSDWKKEIIYILAGFFGGALYFYTENTALAYTFASNVGLIVAATPILTAFIAHYLISSEPLRRRLVIGGLIAFVGAGFVIFNGQFVLQLNPLGDALAIAAALSFAFYSVFIKLIGTDYSSLYITRKVFFYSIITTAPFMIWGDFTWDFSAFMHVDVWLHLLFLGLIASAGCFAVWNQAINVLGAVKTNHFIYFIPFLTMLFSVWLLAEKITWLACVGSVFIIYGVYLAEKQEKAVTGMNKG